MSFLELRSFSIFCFLFFVRKTFSVQPFSRYSSLARSDDKIKIFCLFEREIEGWSPGLVVMGEDSCSEGHGFQS